MHTVTGLTMPLALACQQQGTAKLDPKGAVDCLSTRLSGGCPFQSALEHARIKPGILASNDAISCALSAFPADQFVREPIERATRPGPATAPPLDQFGDIFNGGLLDPQQCREYADWIETHEKQHRNGIRDTLIDDAPIFIWEIAPRINNGPYPVDGNASIEGYEERDNRLPEHVYLEARHYLVWWMRFVADNCNGAQYIIAPPALND